MTATVGTTKCTHLSLCQSGDHDMHFAHKPYKHTKLAVLGFSWAERTRVHFIETCLKITTSFFEQSLLDRYDRYVQINHYDVSHRTSADRISVPPLHTSLDRNKK